MEIVNKARNIINEYDRPGIRLKYLLFNEKEFMELMDWAFSTCSTGFAQQQAKDYLDRFKAGAEYNLYGVTLKYKEK